MALLRYIWSVFTQQSFIQNLQNNIKKKNSNSANHSNDYRSSFRFHLFRISPFSAERAHCWGPQVFHKLYNFCLNFSSTFSYSYWALSAPEILQYATGNLNSHSSNNSNNSTHSATARLKVQTIAQTFQWKGGIITE